MRFILVLLAAVALSAGTYLGLERVGRRAWLAIAARSLAWTALGLLLLNVSCPRPPVARRPIVLLDGSLSMGSAGRDLSAARRRADSIGEVRYFGDLRPGVDTLPNRGRSLLLPALAAAAASDRPLVVITDGELDDAAEVPPDLLARTAVDVVPRASQPDVAIVTAEGSARITAGDTLRYDVTVRATGDPARDSAVLELRSDDTRRTLLLRRVVRLKGGEARITMRAASAGVTPGEHLLSLRLVDAGDAEPRTDERLLHVAVAETPGVVFVADPGDWDARFLFRAIRDVAALPARGYLRLGEGWRAMADLKPVPEDAVRQAIRRADLVILKGETVARAAEAKGRGLWLWPSGTGGAAQDGDWYLVAAPSSPVAAAMAGLPVDSFPPAVRLTAQQPPADAWVGFMAQLGRRGAPRPAHFGWQSGSTRRVVTAADGLWRWAFRGGSAEQGYRALIGSTVTWLLGSPDTARGLAHPVRPVVMNGRPLVFEWNGPGAARPLAVTWNGATPRIDSLRFDGAGRAEVWLDPGAWRYRIEGGTEGLAAVEQYSDEFIPRSPSIVSKAGAAVTGTARTAARDWTWLFLLGVLGLCVEWLVRRRLGLR